MINFRLAVQIALWVAVATTLGCASKRGRNDVPAVPIPTQFKQVAVVPSELEARPPGSTEAAPLQTRLEPLVGALMAEWWRVLSNPELNALVDRVIANNTDLRIATLRIVQSKARADQAIADRLPTVSAPFEARGEGPKAGIGSVAPGGRLDSQHTYQLSLRTDWRVDLWGERSALAESSRLQLLRSTYQRDDTRRQLIANAVGLYVEYLSLNDRIRVARETEVVLSKLLASINTRVEVGDATIINLEQQRATVYAIQATIPGLELQREAVTNALAQLLGVTSASLTLSDRGLDSLTFPDILPGVPAGLVLRRPDVRAVEARLLAADADIDVARARLLPPLDLTAQFGYGSFVLSQLFKTHTLFWNVIASMTASIFDHGKRSNEVVFSRAIHEELVETYVSVIYAAVRETEDAIATVQVNGRRLRAQEAATSAAHRAWDFSMESYDAGIGDYLTLIDTERTYHRNLDEYHRIRMDRMKGVVSLFSALGGGIPDADADDPSTGSDGESGNDGGRAYPGYATFGSDNDEMYWLVELAGLPDRHGIAIVWRDLRKRFPVPMQDRNILARIQGRVALDDKERASWYRLYVARFDVAEEADSFCRQLTRELQRCRVVTSRDPDFTNFRRDAVEDVRPNADFVRAVAAQQVQGEASDEEILPALRLSVTLGAEPAAEAMAPAADVGKAERP